MKIGHLYFYFQRNYKVDLSITNVETLAVNHKVIVHVFNNIKKNAILFRRL